MQCDPAQRQQTVGQILRISLQPVGNRHEVLARVQPVAGRVLADGARIGAHSFLIIVVVRRCERIRIGLLAVTVFEMEHRLTVGEDGGVVLAAHGDQRDGVAAVVDALLHGGGVEDLHVDGDGVEARLRQF